MSNTKCKTKSNSKRKRKETLDFVWGLLSSADEISEKLPNDFHPREQLHKKHDVSGRRRADPGASSRPGRWKWRSWPTGAPFALTHSSWWPRSSRAG